MLIDFKELKDVSIANLNGGNGEVVSKMFFDGNNRIMISRLPKGVSIGAHTHTEGGDINYVLSGSGTAVCNGKEEKLVPGVCHYCPRGSEHSILNTGDEDLVLFTAVPKQDGSDQ